MPNNHIGTRTKFLSSEGSKSYTQNLAKAFDGYKSVEDVTLHCRGKIKLKTNKISLLFSSKLFQKIFETNCDCNTNILQEYNVVCPDFDPKCMAKVLELINYGTTKLSSGDDELRTGMISIIQSFQINIHLEPKASDNIPQKISDMSDKLKDIKNTSLSSQNMDDKIEMTSQKTTKKGDEIRMSESSDIIDITTQNTFDSIYNPSINEIPDRLTEIPKSSTHSEINEIITKLSMPYSCEFCDRRFQLLIGLKQHLSKHLTKSKLHKSASVVEQQKQEQQEEQRQQEQIKNDQQEVIDLENDEKSSLLCPFCDKLFKNVMLYQVHLKNHSHDNSSDRGQTVINLSDGEASDNKIDICLKQGDKNDQQEMSDGESMDNDFDMMDKLEINWSETSSQHLTYGTVQKSQKGGTNWSIKCPVCSSGRTTYQDLLVHMVMRHYKEKVNQLSDKSQRNCQMCEKQFNTYSNLISHLVSGKHKVLNKIVPQEMVESLRQIKATIYSKKGKNKMKNIRRRRKSVLNTNICLNQGEEDEKEVLSMIKIPKIIHTNRNRQSTNFKCPICQCKKTQFNHLKVHIGIIHYKDEVIKLFNKETHGCSLCKKTFKSNDHVKSHLVQKHQILSQLLPSELLKKLEDMNGNSRKRHSI